MSELAKAQLAAVVNLIAGLLDKRPDYYGTVKLNFQNGHFTHANVEQSVKVEDIPTVTLN